VSEILDHPPGSEHPHDRRPPQPQTREIGLANNPLRLLFLVGAFLALGLAFGVNVLVMLGAIVVSIFLHEMGHFIAARKTGMKATEFFIGFGPKLWSFKRGETEYGVKLVWLGAYVKIIGMNTLEDVPAADEARTYRQQTYPKRVLVAFAGPGMNFVFALVLMFTLYAFIGIPGQASFPIDDVVADSAAADAGVERGDTIVAIDGVPVDEWEDTLSIVGDLAGETVALEVERDGEVVDLTATVGERTLDDGSTAGFLGVAASQISVREAPLEAAGSTFEAFGEVTYQSVAGLVRFFSPSGLSNFAEEVVSTPPAGNVDEAVEPTESGAALQGGPSSGADRAPENSDRVISILGVVQIGRHLGIADIVGLLAALNIFLALFNLVPLLPFDGGHIAVATYERIRSRKGVRYTADYAKLIPVTYVVVALIVSVGLGAIYLDAVNPVQVPN
jgi:membrane-associated protease RseP (regulator of RpoE activity)